MANGDGFFSDLFGGLGGLFSDGADGLGEFGALASVVTDVGGALGAWGGDGDGAMTVQQRRPIAPTIIPSPMGGMARTVGRASLSRFPMLSGAIGEWAAKGIRVTASSLTTLLRKYGPEALVAFGILSVASLTELLMYNASRKRRRMNPLNPRALGRSTRRLLSFQRRASRVNMALAGVCRTRGRSRARRCMTCRKNPCVC